MLVAPENDPSRRRHAHTACVARERAAGRLRSRDEWLAATGQAPEPGWLRRLVRKLGPGE